MMRYSKHILTLFFVFILSLIFISCSASKHPGVTTVEKPPMDEDNKGVWINYWQDQFDAYEGNVVAPDSDYPEAARQAYQEAKRQWDKKVMEAANKTQIAYYAAGIAIPVLVYAILL